MRTSVLVSLLISSPLLLTATLSAHNAWAGDAIDTRVTFTLADDDLARGPEESETGSPSLPNSQPGQANRTFFDDFERRDKGFENLTHLVLYAKEPGFFEGLDTEAALVLRLENDFKKGVFISEDGSYLKINKDFGGDNSLSLTAFPVSADRFVLGYSYDISWGGRGMFKSRRGGAIEATPGMRLEWRSPGTYGFVGFKTAVAQTQKPDRTVEEDTVWGILGGGGIDVAEELRLEFGAGLFNRGTIDKPELQVLDAASGRYRTAPWYGYGGSMQVTYHIGMPIGTPVDFRLYKNDPLKQQSFFKQENYAPGTSFSVQSEATMLGQTLQDPERPWSTVNQTAIAADFAAKVKIDNTRLHMLAVYRNLAFILYNVPSSPSYVAFPDGIATLPEAFVSAGIDYYLEDWHLTPGLILGVQQPASMTGAAAETSQQQTLVFREAENISLLDPGDKVDLVFAAKGTLRWQLSQLMAAVAELKYEYDPNRTILAQDPNGIAHRTHDLNGVALSNIFGFNLMLQARF